MLKIETLIRKPKYGTFEVRAKETRKKLEDKSLKCVFLGVSETFKAYKLYDPLTKKVVVSRDVIFDENQTWLDMGRKDHCESADSCRS